MSKEKFAMRVGRGAIQPADELTRQRLNERLRVGDLVFVQFIKPRNPKFHRLAHKIGQLCQDNIEAFSGLGQHEILKRLQLEAQVGCDEMHIFVPGFGLCQHLTPKSLSYESMDQTEFERIMLAICDHIATTYWPTMDAASIESMAETMLEHQ